MIREDPDKFILETSKFDTVEQLKEEFPEADIVKSSFVLKTDDQQETVIHNKTLLLTKLDGKIW